MVDCRNSYLGRNVFTSTISNSQISLHNRSQLSCISESNQTYSYTSLPIGFFRVHLDGVGPMFLVELALDLNSKLIEIT